MAEYTLIKNNKLLYFQSFWCVLQLILSVGANVTRENAYLSSNHRHNIDWFSVSIQKIDAN